MSNPRLVSRKTIEERFATDGDDELGRDEHDLDEDNADEEDVDAEASKPRRR